MDRQFTQEEMKAFHRAMGSKGGKAATVNLTKEERSAIGYKLAAARAAKKVRDKEAKAKLLVDDAFKNVPNINGE